MMQFCAYQCELLTPLEGYVFITVRVMVGWVVQTTTLKALEWIPLNLGEGGERTKEESLLQSQEFDI